jgi:putative transposase
MKKRKWTAQQKLQIVLEGMSGKVPLGELCTRHQISQTQYYQWRDRLMKDGAKVFERGGPDQEAERLNREVHKLKAIIGDLTVELKKSELGVVVSNRNRSQRVIEADQELLAMIEPIKRDHPAWGYRRVWAYLRYRLDVKIGKNRIYRILKENRLLSVNPRKLRAKRTSGRAKPRCNEPNRLWGIDMTKIKVESWGWLYLVVVKDWASKKIVGW